MPLPSTQLPAELGEYIARDVELLRRGGWKELVASRRGRGDFTSLNNVQHPAQRLLRHYKHRGAPVKFSTPPWPRSKIEYALKRGPHKSCEDYLDFLNQEFIEMVARGQWVVLPYSAVKDMPGLRASPPGVIPQHGRRPRWIVDYSYWGINEETLPLAALESMQFGRALDRILREILLANPEHGPVHLLKIDLSDGFYRVDVNPDDIPKLGVVFPTRDGEEQLMAFPLVLPMGWSNSPPVFSTVTETIADIANTNIAAASCPSPHHLDDLAESIPSPSPFADSAAAKSPAPGLKDGVAEKSPAPVPSLEAVMPLQAVLNPNPSHMTAPPWSSPTMALDNSREPQRKERAGGAHTHGKQGLSPQSIPRDPSLPTSNSPLSYVDVFVDDFIGLAQQYHPNVVNSNARRVRRIMMHAIDSVIRPLEPGDNPFRKEPVSLKKLRQGDCSWGTIKEVLGWVIDTVNMTIQLPQRRLERLAEILNSIPTSQKRTSVKKWHKVLGELRSMSIALPGARNLFSTMQNALGSKKGGRVALDKGVHHALEDFRWMFENIKTRPTNIAELVPLLPSAEGHHDASGKGAGGIWFPGAHLMARYGFLPLVPLVWRLEWPECITSRLVTEDNPDGDITNSDLELAGGLLQLEAISHCFDVRLRTLLSKGDNLATTFWERKGSTSSTKPPAYLLRLFGMHQRFHQYVPRFDYISGISNHVADALSRDFHLEWPDLISSLSSYFPQNAGYQVWTPSPQIVSAVISALLKKRSARESLMVEPPAPTQAGASGVSSQLTWASTPFSKPSKTKYPCYSSMPNEFVVENLQPTRIQSGLDRLKITYGSLDRRSQVWGPLTPA